jgi:hypothetical protein
MSNEFISSSDTKGIILLEGRKGSKEPLILEIMDDKKQTVFEIKMPLSLDTPENMYRHVELRSVINENGKIEGNYTGIPQNYPDEMTNGKNLIFIHGYKVAASSGIGWLSEIFKRFYWSGSNARFYGVSWAGDADNGKILPAPYQKNIVNAFKTAPYLATVLASIQGDKILAAHSAGNMVASHAIVNHGLTVQKYFMLNAAVPVEAYDESAVCNQPYLTMNEKCGEFTPNPDWTDPKWPRQPNPMVAWPDWLGQTTGNFYDSKTWSANYYQLFAGTADVRSQLTWRGLFQNERLFSIAYNFYSAGEAWYSGRGDEVFELHPTLDWGIGTGALTDSARYAWQKQENCKGDHCTGSSLTGGTPYAGWGFYTKEETGGDPPVTVTKPFYSASEANSLPLDTLKTAPVFRHNPPQIFGNPQALTDFSGVDNLKTREAVLAMAIPALSPAAGGSEIKKFNGYSTGKEDARNFNLDQDPNLRNGWPRNNSHTYKTRWLHTDLKDAAYLYTYPFYQKMVKLGQLNIE